MTVIISTTFHTDVLITEIMAFYHVTLLPSILKMTESSVYSIWVSIPAALGCSAPQKDCSRVGAGIKRCHLRLDLCPPYSAVNFVTIYHSESFDVIHWKT